MDLRIFYLFAAIIGTVVPWLFFGSFFTTHGVDIRVFVQALFANPAAGGFSADVLISILVFWVWSYDDASRNGVRKWWFVLPAGFCVGLSLALPLYLLLRSGSAQAGWTGARPSANRGA